MIPAPSPGFLRTSFWKHLKDDERQGATGGRDANADIRCYVSRLRSGTRVPEPRLTTCKGLLPLIAGHGIILPTSTTMLAWKAASSHRSVSRQSVRRNIVSRSTSPFGDAKGTLDRMCAKWASIRVLARLVSPR